MSSANPSFLGRVFGEKRNHRGSPKKSVENLKTLAFVVPLTVMIWIYAENAQKRPPEDMSVRVQFVTSNSGNAATVPTAGQDGPELRLSVEGTRGQVEKFKDTIEKNSSDGILKLALPGNNDLGNKSVNIVDAFRSDPAFYGMGVTVKSTPSDLPVTVEKMDPIEVPIVAPEGLSVTLQNVSFNPPRVKATGPLSAIRNEFGDSPRITVDTAGLDLSASTVSRTQKVTLVSPKNGRIKLSQQTVDMTYDVGSMVRDGEIRSVFIDVRRPYAEEGRYRVIIRGQPVVTNVLVTGPSNSVDKVTGNSAVPVRAVLEVTKDDVDKGEITRKVTFDFDPIDPSIKPIGEHEVKFEVKSITPDGDR